MADEDYDINDLKRRMQGALSVFKNDLAGLRTGRASASLLDPIVVVAYGSTMPLNQVATVSVPEPRMLSVQVWDKGMVHAVEKPIRESNLGLNPIVVCLPVCMSTSMLLLVPIDPTCFTTYSGGYWKIKDMMSSGILITIGYILVSSLWTAVIAATGALG